MIINMCELFVPRVLCVKNKHQCY